jgi:hypothetical protein
MADMILVGSPDSTAVFSVNALEARPGIGLSVNALAPAKIFERSPDAAP